MSKLKTIIFDGVAAAWPICLGYIPIGLAFGVLAQKAGLGPLEIFFMSLLVFAGSSQFIAVSMLDCGAALTSIILTTFTVNLRHLLMSSALAVYFTKSSRKKLSLLAYGVTDESFAVNYSRLKTGKWDIERSLVLNHSANMIWIISTVAGGFGGQFIPAGAFGIDYALPAMFICLLVFQFNGRKYLFVAMLAGALAVLLSLALPGNMYVVMASMLAATCGTVLKRFFEKSSVKRKVNDQ
ncbi:MAG: branched-chain amino acid ABC transporter permease [Desulfobacteraceae bacterium 4572_123]|nr:MAG: branched-chain amino acid ABC transporter permease [Desulfobacteraceae bacterium 4572_123]